ncbi:MAG: Aspartate/glutamate leucyltransferase [Phycisphaerae bacterium]|nr:Aspartate/glutamate leucyltransferase [Phycisphaerae bacterium]
MTNPGDTNNREARRRVDEFLQMTVLPTGPLTDCPYLPGRPAVHEGFSSAQLDPEIYHALLDQGFRRSGQAFYRPHCPTCRECVSLRVVVADFRHSRSQRRVWRSNHDIRVERHQPPQFDEEKVVLYQRYQQARHQGPMGSEPDDLYAFLYQSPVATMELCYYLDRTLVGVSLVDRSQSALSSVYMFFDPQYARRRLGTYSILWEVNWCREQGLEYYYLGYYIADCTKMAYKADFQPHERRGEDGSWRRPTPDEEQSE